MRRSALRVTMLILVATAVTGLVVAVLNTGLNIITPCYTLDRCASTPATGAVGYFIDILKYVAYFGIFPLATALRKNDFRRLSHSRRIARASRIIVALLPVILYPLTFLFNITLF